MGTAPYASHAPDAGKRSAGESSPFSIRPAREQLLGLLFPFLPSAFVQIVKIDMSEVSTFVDVEQRLVAVLAHISGPKSFAAASFTGRRIGLVHRGTTDKV